MQSSTNDAAKLDPAGSMTSLASSIASIEKSEPEAESLSPFLALPVELLSHILHLALRGAVNRESKLLTVLLSICHRLRAVALGTPSLWTTIRITSGSQVDELPWQLSLSGVLPLDVTIECKCRNHSTIPCEQGRDGLMHSIDLLKLSLPRCATLALALPSCWLTQEALASCGDSLYRLERLSLRTQHSDRGDYNTSLSDLLCRMPRLREIDFKWYSLRWEAGTLPSIRTIRLLHYFMDDPETMINLLNFLHACPNLEELELTNMAERYAYPSVTVTTPDVMGSLKKLTLRDCGNGKAEMLLAAIVCPNLETLELTSLGDIDRGLALLAARIIERAPVTVLRINNCRFSETRLVGLLDKLSSLTSLEITDCENLAGEVLTHLAEETDGAWAVPDLRVLSLRKCYSIDLDALERLVRVRASRVESSPPKNLTSLDLTGLRVKPLLKESLEREVFLKGGE